MDINRKRVLIVDDDSKSRRVFQDMLSISGFETVLASNGEDAMDLLAEDPYFDLIITDVMMPYQTGFDFAGNLKKYAETKKIPVIATSAFHNWKKARVEHALDVDGFIPKPVNKTTLMIEIRRVIGE